MIPLNHLSRRRHKELKQLTCQEILRFACEYEYLATHPKVPMATIITQIITPSGIEHLKEALRAPSGVMILSIHFGGFLFSFLTLAHLGKTLGSERDILILKQAPPSEQEASCYQHFQNQGYRIEILRTGNHFLGKVFKSLEHKGILISFLDIPAHSKQESIPVQFLGESCRFASGLIKIALRTQSVILPIVTVREAREKQMLLIHPPLPPQTPNPDSATQLAQKMADLASAAIFAHPHAWHHWGHFDRFLQKERTDVSTHETRFIH